MKAKRFATEAEAIEFAKAVDEAAGMPIYGVDVGGGRHVDPELSKTLHVSDYVFDEKAADGEKYAYIVTSGVEALADTIVNVDGKLVEVDLVGVKDDFEYEKVVKS